jgi:hypothetical protein
MYHDIIKGQEYQKMSAQEQTLSPIQIKQSRLIESIVRELVKQNWRFLDYSDNSVENKYEYTTGKGLNLVILHRYNQAICEIRFWCAHFVDLFMIDSSGNYVMRPGASAPSIVLTEDIFTEIVMRKLMHPFSH